MLFSSFVFIFYFFPIVLLGYYILKFSRTAQNIWLLVASLFFYAWGEPLYVLLMIASIVLNWFLGLMVAKKSKTFLVIGIIINIGILFVYKYLNFVLENINDISGKEIFSMVKITLPIGISFFTFQALSYIIDVYRQKTQKEKNLFYVGLYISFFPQLIAGPIVQYQDVASQIRERKETFNKFSLGICRFVSGLGKKVLLANSFAIIADRIFNWSQMGSDIVAIPVTLAWLGAFAYALQIYFDFSAYSDMAIGLGLIFGFKFEENFNYPYISKSLTEFWRRWHMSLSGWFREYVYFPLGGSRVKTKDIMVRNLFIVWILTGIWHGASWTFFFWGLWNFIFILAERFFGYYKKNTYPFFRHVYVIFVFVIGWVFFRAQDLFQAGEFLKNMFGMNQNGFFSGLALVFLKEYWFWLFLGILFSTPIALRMNSFLLKRKSTLLTNVATILYPIVLSLLFIICVSYLARGTYNPFIYFNF